MREPANHTAVVDKFGDTWVRCDDYPIGPLGIPCWGPWHPLTDGPCYDEGHRPGVGQPRPWHQVDPRYAPFTEADPERTAWALEMVRKAVEDE